MAQVQFGDREDEVLSTDAGRDLLIAALSVISSTLLNCPPDGANRRKRAGNALWGRAAPLTAKALAQS
jgi:hypothetical protein